MKAATTLIILDGYGLSEREEGNAIRAANTPVMDALLRDNPHARLSASGRDVGLPDGTMGNSEVGHTNIGAGRVVYQNLLRISNAIEDGSFFENPVLVQSAQDCRDRGGAAHIFGLLSDVGVHSHDSHIWAMLRLLRDSGLSRIYLHCFTDGRDSSPTSGRMYMRRCLDKCAELGAGRVATVMGRFYAMDRDNRWERVERAYNAIVYAEGLRDPDPVHAIEASYEAGKTDEFIEPVICDPEGIVNSGDAVYFINFRPDRARELTRAFTEEKFDGFVRRNGFFQVDFVCATQYDAALTNLRIAYPPELPKNTFGEFLSRLGMTQLRIAETEKYAHVTFFFNGGAEGEFAGEDRVLIPSPKEFPTYDLIPQMRAYDIADEVCRRLRSGKYDVIVVNFANCDMVGHTGNFDAVVQAAEAVDVCVGRVLDACAEVGATAIVTADHGNAEQMLEEDGVSPHTAHTTNLVPFVISGANVRLRDGRLCDIVPTMLDLMGLEKPQEMTGESLIVS